MGNLLDSNSLLLPILKCFKNVVVLKSLLNHQPPIFFKKIKNKQINKKATLLFFHFKYWLHPENAARDSLGGCCNIIEIMRLTLLLVLMNN